MQTGDARQHSLLAATERDGLMKEATMTIGKNRSTEKGRELWDAVDAAAAEVRTWPAWKRGIAEERPQEKPPHDDDHPATADSSDGK